MQFEVLFLLLFGFCYSAPHAGLPLIGPDGIGGIFKGPDSETIIRGPDGSEITSEQKGGAVVQEDGLIAQPIVVAEPAVIPQAVTPVLTNNQPLITVSSTLAPLLESVEPSTLLTGEVAPLTPLDLKPVEIVQQDPHIIETEIIEAPEVESEQSSDLTGPSGRIITKGSASVVSGPASTTITEPRKIIVAPPKLSLETPLVAPQTVDLPIVSSSTISPIPSIAVSTTGLEGWVGGSSTIDSSRIDLGVEGSVDASIPLVEYSSSNGVVNGQVDLLSSTSAPLISSTLSNLGSTGDLGVPATHLLPPPAPLVSSTASPNIQRIARLQDTIPDGRIDMGYRPKSYEYKLPQVLSSALSRFYSKPLSKPRDSLVIDDKMGELTQNEIAYDIGPSEINLEQVPLSQVSQISDGSYHQSGLTGGWGKK